jgi:hypothetical protein
MGNGGGGFMSHTSQGPGWWLASDENWCAPELHPNFLPPWLDIEAKTAVCRAFARTSA